MALSTGAKIAVGIVTPLIVIAAVLAFFLLRLHRQRTTGLLANSANNLPKNFPKDKAELPGSLFVARVTEKPELDATLGEAKNIPPANSTPGELPAEPLGQNTISVQLGLANTDHPIDAATGIMTLQELAPTR